MLPDGHFYRNIPVCFDPQERLRHEALLFAQDAMEAALERLTTQALQKDMCTLLRAERIQMFTDAWTIVDQVHVARQMIESLTRPETRLPETAAYLSDHEAAHRMRNAMDHLNQNIGNRARSKGVSTPLFGIISYFRPYSDFVKTEVQDYEVKGDLVIIMIGSTPQSLGQGYISFDNFRVGLPISNLKIEAFGQELNLDAAVTNLRPLIQRFANQMQTAFRENIDRLVKSTGHSIERLKETNRIDATLVLEMGIRVNQQTAPSSSEVR